MFIPRQGSSAAGETYQTLIVSAGTRLKEIPPLCRGQTEKLHSLLRNTTPSSACQRICVAINNVVLTKIRHLLFPSTSTLTNSRRISCINNRVNSPFYLHISTASAAISTVYLFHKNNIIPTINYPSRSLYLPNTFSQFP